MPPTSPSPSGRGVRGEGKNAEGQKNNNPAQYSQKRLLPEPTRDSGVRFWSNDVLQPTDPVLSTAGTVAGGGGLLALTPTPLPEGEGLKMTFSIGCKLAARYAADIPLSLWEMGQG